VPLTRSTPSMPASQGTDARTPRQHNQHDERRIVPLPDGPRRRAAGQSSALIGDDEAGSARVGRRCDIGRIQRAVRRPPVSPSPTAYQR
jgi:hypothetical protein